MMRRSSTKLVARIGANSQRCPSCRLRAELPHAAMMRRSSTGWLHASITLSCVVIPFGCALGFTSVFYTPIGVFSTTSCLECDFLP